MNAHDDIQSILSSLERHPDMRVISFTSVVMAARTYAPSEIWEALPQKYKSHFRKWIQDLVIKDVNEPIFIFNHGGVIDSTKLVLEFKKFFASSRENTANNKALD